MSLQRVLHALAAILFVINVSPALAQVEGDELDEVAGEGEAEHFNNGGWRRHDCSGPGGDAEAFNNGGWRRHDCSGPGGERSIVDAARIEVIVLPHLADREGRNVNLQAPDGQSCCQRERVVGVTLMP